MRFRLNTQRSEFINGAPADWIDPMAEEATGHKQTPPSVGPIFSDKTKNREAEIVVINEENPPINGSIQVLDKSPSKLFEVMPTDLSQEVNSPSNGFIKKHGSCLSESLVATPINSPRDAEKSSSSISSSSQLKIDSSSPTARMQLDDICTFNNWEQPAYILCREEGPDHEKMFTFKVIVGVDGISMTILECFSDPKPHKIAAQEHAAEAAIWYLNHLGYSSKL